MKGAGEPYFEYDFLPGLDIMGDIQSGPKAAERMEFELFDRLAHYMDLYSEKQVGVNTDEDKDEEDKYNGNVSDKGQVLQVEQAV